MKKSTSRLLSTLLVLCMVLALLPAAVIGAGSGACGDSATWTLDDNGYLTISGTGIVEQPETVYEDWAGVKTIEVGEGITELGTAVFKLGGSVTKVALPETLTVIGEAAFYWESALAEVNIPAGVTEIGDGAFFGCTSLPDIALPSGLLTIGEQAFVCGPLTGVTVPRSVTNIGEQALGYCYTENDFRVTVEAIPGFTVRGYAGTAAEEYAKANSFTFVPLEDEEPVAAGSCGDDLTWTLGADGTLAIEGTGPMDDYEYFMDTPWYNYLDQIHTVTIGDGVTSIGAFAFSAAGMTSVTIPDSVTSIGRAAFLGCPNLFSVTIPDSVTSIGMSAFANCGLSSVTIPSGITSIGDSVFLQCDNLTSVTIPSGVTSIRFNAFGMCTNLTSVTIPSTVTWIEEYAFGGCDNLADVYFDGSKTRWEQIVIDDFNAPLLDAKIHYNSVGTAYPGTLKAEIDGRPVEFNTYALKEGDGYITYVQVRDLALAMNGTQSPFNVTQLTLDSGEKVANLISNTEYVPNGNEGSIPFSGERDYTLPTKDTYIDSKPSDLVSFVLTSDNGGGYTYYQIRDLGRKLGFSVGWNGDLGAAVITSGTGN